MLGHHFLIGARALRDAANRRGGLAAIARAVGRGHDAGAAAVGLLAAIVETQRLDDQPRRLVLGDRERLAVEERPRIAHRVLARRHRDPPEVEAGDAVLVHVALGEHRHPARGRHEAEGHVPAPMDEIGGGRPVGDAGAVALTRAAVERAVAHHRARRAGGDRHRRLMDHADRGAAAVGHAAEEREVADAHGTRHLDLVARVEGERGHAVDVGGAQPGVVEGGGDRFAGELNLGAPRVLRVVGLADADDRGLIPQRRGHAWLRSLLGARPDGSCAVTRRPRAAATRPSRSRGFPTSSCR